MTRKSRVGLALAGGGPLGAIYEIGALCALQEALEGVSLERLDHYVGVSAGGFMAAALANGIAPHALCASFIEGRAAEGDEFDPSWLLVPAWGEFARRALMLPGAALSTAWQLLVRRKTLLHSIQGLGPALPAGIFSNDLLEQRLSALFTRPGRTNDFRKLSTRLTLVATDLDTGEPAPFGRPGWDHVPISRAVQATSALPGLFPPVEIDDKCYVDGALNKTMHASVALEDGVDLLLCINPLVPFDARGSVTARGRSKAPIPRIVDGGLPAVLSQTFRSMIHSRMTLGMKQYERRFPHKDILLIEPDRTDPEIYGANTFSYSQRGHLAEHAYQQTRNLLIARHDQLAPMLARHGIRIRQDVLARRRQLVAPTPRKVRLGETLERLGETLDELSASLQAQGA